MTEPSVVWHAAPGDLAAYAAGRIDDVRAASVEAHVVSCAECRAILGSALVDESRIDRLWNEVVDRIDAPRPGPVEWFLARLGVSNHTARVLAATPSLRLPWLLAVAYALIFSAGAAQLGGDRTLAMFLMIAPLLPLAGVAAAFGPGLDPTIEITSASPMAGFRLLLLRATTVFAATFVLAALASVTLPATDGAAAAWVLPALGLTLATLAIGTVTTAERAAGLVAALWVTGVLTAAREAHNWLAAFGSTGQAVSVLVIIAAVVVLATRRETLEFGRPTK